MDFNTQKEKVEELLSITKNISNCLLEEEVNSERVAELIESRQVIIDEFKSANVSFDSELQEELKKIYEMDLENEKNIKVVLEDYAKSLRYASNARKQISYYPKTTNQEGLFIDKKS